MQNNILSSLQEAQLALQNLIANETQIAKIEQAANCLVAALESKATIFSCGNGGSMCDAMHFAEELTGRYRDNRRGHAAVAISDPSHLSCVANDFGYQYVFSRYLESHARKGDVLLAMSTSGSSQNVIEAVNEAKKLGVASIVLSGRAESPLAALADIYICTQGGAYADRVQELHIKLLHIFIELIERHFHPENYDL